MKKIKYIGFYDIKEFKDENRNYGIAGKNKMEYICDSLVNAGYKVEIISPSWSANTRGFYRSRNTKIKNNIYLYVGPTFGARFIISKIFRMLFSWAWLFLYLIFNVKKDEKVIVYHSLGLSYPLFIATVIKRINIILEFEEEYCRIKNQPGLYKWIEKKIINIADRYILPNDLMIEKYCFNKDKCIVIYGQYSIYYQKKIHNTNDNIISLVYAGIIDEDEGSVFKAVELSRYLSGKYRINILGKANKQDLGKLIKLINLINRENECRVNYNGFFEGNHYIRKLLDNHIGLNLREKEADYIDYAFPSKILSYLGAGLRVVSSRIKCVERSKIGDLLYYYDSGKIDEIAETIKKIDLGKPYDSRIRLKELNNQFINDLNNILER
jgi:hypothetical protein